MTQEQINELLKPRYKVIADYPKQWHNKGHVIENLFYDDEFKTEDFFDQYPDIFKRLEWWQERRREEMPDYVKSLDDGPCFKVHEWHFLHVTFFVIKKYDQLRNAEWFNPEMFLPATSADYNEYLQTLTHNQES